MPGETDLGALLRAMTPTLREGEYVFCTLPPGTALPPGVVPLATFAEAEGLSAIVAHEAALRAGLAGAGPFALITLAVHSSLDAIGFLAAVTRALAEANIPANAVAAYHHDHLFVPVARAGEAVRALRAAAAPSDS